MLRLLNPTDEPVTAAVALGFPVRAARPARLDEEPLASGSGGVALAAGALSVEVGAHALCTVLLEP
ncbi:MAG: hypothetical protein FJW88_13310 [Actinobacteria bacterium]|nr:hypothetical protein [Actinomycetota bacterium]